MNDYLRQMIEKDNKDEQPKCLENKVLTAIFKSDAPETNNNHYCAFHYHLGENCKFLRYKGKMQTCSYYDKD